MIPRNLVPESLYERTFIAGGEGKENEYTPARLEKIRNRYREVAVGKA